MKKLLLSLGSVAAIVAPVAAVVACGSDDSSTTTKFATDKDTLVASIKALPNTHFDLVKGAPTTTAILDLVKDAEIVKKGTSAVDITPKKDIVLLKSSTIVAKLGDGFTAHGATVKAADKTNAHPWTQKTTQQGVGQNQLLQETTIESRYQNVTEDDIKKADAILVAETNTAGQKQISIIAVDKTKAAIYWENVFEV